MHIRFSKLGFLGLALALPLSAGCYGSGWNAEFPKRNAWTQRTVNSGAALTPAAVKVADFDGDGNQDIVAAYQGVTGTASPAVYIFFQTDVDNFTAVQIASSDTLLAGISALAVGDLDGDTHRDVVAACDGQLVYLHSPVDPRVSAGWTLTEFDESSGTNIGQWNDVVIGDIDGLNGDDLVACNENTGRVSWFVSPTVRTSGANWTRVDIATTGRTNASSVLLDDINGDGKLDVYSTAPGETSGRVAWYSNPTDPATDTWTKTIVGNFAAASRMALGDLNVDGRTDLVVLNRPGRQIGWYKKTTTPTIANWTGYMLTQYSSVSPIDLQVVDVDGNSQPDVVIATQDSGTLRWFTPIGTQTLQWGENNLVDISQNIARIGLGDIDADGRSDVVAPLLGATTADDGIAWFENPE